MTSRRPSWSGPRRTCDSQSLTSAVFDSGFGTTIPMPDHSPIPGRDAEEMARHSPVLSTVKYGGVSTDRACLRRVAAPIMSTWAVPTPWQGGAVQSQASRQSKLSTGIDEPPTLRAGGSWGLFGVA